MERPAKRMRLDDDGQDRRSSEQPVAESASRVAVSEQDVVDRYTQAVSASGQRCDLWRKSLIDSQQLGILGCPKKTVDDGGDKANVQRPSIDESKLRLPFLVRRKPLLGGERRVLEDLYSRRKKEEQSVARS